MKPLLTAVVSFAIMAFACAPGHAAGAASGKPTVSIVSSYNERLLLTVPAGFTLLEEEVKTPNFLTLSAVLWGESTQVFSQRVSVTSMKVETKAGQTLERLVQQHVGMMGYGCSQSGHSSFKDFPIGPVAVQGGSQGIAVVLVCDSDTFSPAGKPARMSALTVGIKGEKDFFLLEWQEVEKHSEQPLTFDKAKWSGRLQALMPIRLCPNLPDKGRPNSGCSQRK
jgi:hypothetical protein